jgi:hypothetical protein
MKVVSVLGALLATSTALAQGQTPPQNAAVTTSNPAGTCTYTSSGCWGTGNMGEGTCGVFKGTQKVVYWNAVYSASGAGNKKKWATDSAPTKYLDQVKSVSSSTQKVPPTYNTLLCDATTCWFSKSRDSSGMKTAPFPRPAECVLP